MPLIRDETPTDGDAIGEVNRLAFGGEEEPALVERLRAEGLFIASLVAEEQGSIVGHILFTRLPVETPRGLLRAAALAPMAVLPAWQRRGIGSTLVRRGLEALRRRGVAVVIVLGHPGYYPRFGFSAEKARALTAPFSGDAFMALELEPDALAGITGTVRYPEAFGISGENAH